MLSSQVAAKLTIWPDFSSFWQRRNVQSENEWRRRRRLAESRSSKQFSFYFNVQVWLVKKLSKGPELKWECLSVDLSFWKFFCDDVDVEEEEGAHHLDDGLLRNQEKPNLANRSHHHHPRPRLIPHTRHLIHLRD